MGRKIFKIKIFCVQQLLVFIKHALTGRHCKRNRYRKQKILHVLARLEL